MVAKIAAAHDATAGQVALAWLLARSPVMLPIPGTGSVEHLEENVAAAVDRAAPPPYSGTSPRRGQRRELIAAPRRPSKLGDLEFAGLRKSRAARGSVALPTIRLFRGGRRLSQIGQEDQPFKLVEASVEPAR